MKRALLLIAAACGHGGNHAGGGGDDGAGDAALAGDGRGGATDAATDAPGAPGPVPLVACGSPVEVDLALPTSIEFDTFGSYQPPPLLMAGATARVFYDPTGEWMTSAHGTAQTAAWPAPLTGGIYFAGQRSASGGAVVAFDVTGQPTAAPWTGSTVASAIAIPCTGGQIANSVCEVRAAGDGHLWVRSEDHLYEQTAQGFADRGGAPVGITVFDVNAAGDVLIGSIGFGDTLFQIWTLPHGAVGWTNTGNLTRTIVGAAGTAIEGGFQFDRIVGRFAPDGSIHLFSDATCIAEGVRNKAQLYIRSKDGVTWDVETLPDIGTFTDGQVTWADEAVWASDYDNVRFVNESSPMPQQDSGGIWIYPDRQLNAIGRCLDGAGHPAFERFAKARLPGWTTRGFAAFSETGAGAFLTTLGLTQVYR